MKGRDAPQGALFDQESRKLGPAEMEDAFLSGDASYDGLFWAGVTTTGVFCRPSCPARKAKKEHLQYYSSPAEALEAGFRPCGRCRPLAAPGDGAPAWVEALVEEIEADPTRRIAEAELAERGIEPKAARRWFLQRYGLSFQAYCRARRLGEAFTAMQDGASIDDAVLDHGWESHSAFRDAFSKAVGSPPGAARDQDWVRVARLETPLGPMLAGATESAVCLLEFADRRRLPDQLAAASKALGLPLLPGAGPLLDRLESQLAEYFSGARRAFDLPLSYPGTEFQRRVWTALLDIPYGETRSYAELAAAIGQDGASRAVGNANGLNRIAVVIPCHRVVPASGGGGGYGGGLWRKLRLLELEGRSGI